MNNQNYGAIKELVTHIRNYDYETVCGAVASADKYPEEYEIPRENTGTLKNQGTVGACVAEVIAQIAEELFKRQLGDREEHSEGYIYAKYRADNSRSYGLIPSTAMKDWTEKGTVPKKYCDKLYEMPDMRTYIEKLPDLDGIAEKYKISAFVGINYADKTKKDAAIKDALTKYNYGLVAISNDYFDESHCIQLTGWNDKTGCYKFKNSWGEKYRDKGHGEIPKEEINQVYLPLLDEIKLPFEDVSTDDWFYKYVKNMYFNGFIKGTSDTLFEPDKPMTRAEVATLIYRVLKNVDERFDILNKTISAQGGK